MEYYQNAISGWLGTSHVVFALLALLFGAITLAKPKGNNVHRIYGYGYFLAMILMNITAIPLTTLFGGIGPFHLFVVISLPTTLLALYYPLFARANPSWLTYHLEYTAWSYVGLVAAFVAEVVARVPIILMIESPDGLVISVFILAATVSAIGAFLIKKYKARLFQSKKCIKGL